MLYVFSKVCLAKQISSAEMYSVGDRVVTPDLQKRAIYCNDIQTEKYKFMSTGKNISFCIFYTPLLLERINVNDHCNKQCSKIQRA